VVCALGELFARAETPGLHSREEATVHTTVDERRAGNRTDRRVDLAYNACYLVVLFSGVVLMAALIVAAFVI
jgi:hypothetical protein